MSIVSEKSKDSLVAKIGARENVARGQIRHLRFDQAHLHLFDKVTEATLTVVREQ